MRHPTSRRRTVAAERAEPKARDSVSAGAACAGPRWPVRGTSLRRWSAGGATGLDLPPRQVVAGIGGRTRSPARSKPVQARHPSLGDVHDRVQARAVLVAAGERCEVAEPRRNDDSRLPGAAELGVGHKPGVPASAVVEEVEERSAVARRGLVEG